MRHHERATHAARFPLHVTMQLKPGLPPLRREREHATLRVAFAAGCDRAGFRLVHYGLSDDQLRLLVEGASREVVVRGLQGLMIRVAKALNKLWGRKGSAFADRYLDRILKTPQDVRLALCDVLTRGSRDPHSGRERGSVRMDAFTSGPWFDGWREPDAARAPDAEERPVAEAKTWLLRAGWRRLGLLGAREQPGE